MKKSPSVEGNMTLCLNARLIDVLIMTAVLLMITHKVLMVIT
ncbi:hypothetical protein [Candidatus Minimicrobia naudis]